MTEIIGVRFKSGGKQYYFDPRGEQVGQGQGVVVETARGVEYGQCVLANTQVEDKELTQPLRPLIRLATPEDERTVAKNREKEEKALTICQQKVAEHGLEMKLVEAEYSFEGNKVIFFFTAEGRVDFRALVKDLAAAIHTRIELRQIGVRDEAKMLGGLGICGRPFCCAQFLDDFQPVSIKMAKTQNLSLNPTKISGTCGRLMCCLKYEQDAYEDLVRHAPKQDSFVETPDGAGTISSVNLLRQQVQVRLESEPEHPRCFHNCEVCVLRSGKGKRPEGYAEPPREQLEKLRRKEEPPAQEPLILSVNPLAAALESVFSGNAPQPEEGEEGEGRPRRSRRRNRGKGRGQAEVAGTQPSATPKGITPKKAQESAPEKAPGKGQGTPQGKSGGKPRENAGQDPKDASSGPARTGERRPGRRRRPRGGGRPGGETGT